MQKRIETFVPAVMKLSRWKDRKKFIEFPLFPGYIFVHSSSHPEALLTVLKTGGVVNFVSLKPGNPTPVPPDEINSLRLIIESGENIDIYPRLKEGTKVRVRRGPLKGAEGIVKRKEDRYMFMVNIEILGRGVGVKIYADDIEAA